MPKRWHPSPDPVESMPLDGTTSKMTLEGPSSSKQQEIPPWKKALKLSCMEAFGQDSDLVKETRKEFFLKHSYNFITEGTCNLSEIFRQMATSAKLLGTSIYKIRVSWMGPNELRQASYALRSLPKGLKFLQAVPPSESPKVMPLVGIHSLDTLCHCSGVTHCPWCGKEGQNDGTVINHLWTVHYRLGLVCNKCHDCLSIMSDTLCHHGQQDCLVTRGGKTLMNQFHQSNYQMRQIHLSQGSKQRGQDGMASIRLSCWEYPYLLMQPWRRTSR